jgi:riboflavin transporter FmnP
MDKNADLGSIKHSSPEQEVVVSARTKWANYFRIDTKRITILAMMVAMNVVMMFFSKYVLGLIPIYNFLVVEVTFFTYLIMLIVTNEFYTLIIIGICSWLRIPAVNDEWVGVLSMNIIDWVAILIIAALYRLLFKALRIDNKTKKTYVAMSIALGVGTIAIAAVAVGMNVALSLPLYNKMYGINFTGHALTVYLAVVFGFNILKFTINSLIFMAGDHYHDIHHFYGEKEDDVKPSDFSPKNFFKKKQTNNTIFYISATGIFLALALYYFLYFDNLHYNRPRTFGGRPRRKYQLWQF